MAVPFGFGIGDFVFFITTAIEIGKRIIDAPKEILAIIKSLENLETYMVELKDLVESSATELKESTKTRLERILRDIEVDVKDTEKILRAWEVKEGPRGIKLRLEPVHRAIWPFGSTENERNTSKYREAAKKSRVIHPFHIAHDVES